MGEKKKESMDIKEIILVILTLIGAIGSIVITFCMYPNLGDYDTLILLYGLFFLFNGMLWLSLLILYFLEKRARTKIIKNALKRNNQIFE